MSSYTLLRLLATWKLYDFVTKVVQFQNKIINFSLELKQPCQFINYWL